MNRTFTAEDDALLAELGVEVEPEKTAGRTPREERILTGFEEIQRFVDANGRAPQHGEGRDIFERLHAVRLDRLRQQEECRALLAPLDRQGLLDDRPEALSPASDGMDDDALLAELGVEAAGPDIAELRHVRSTAEKRVVEEIASRRKCEEFEVFRPLFDQVQQELDTGVRQTRPFELKADIEPGRFFIVGGQKAYVAEMGEEFTQDYGDRDARLRVIFDNGTENNMLRRSLQRALHKDGAGRRITDPAAGPLFADRTAGGDEASGTIYVLRSKADIPFVAENRNPPGWAACRISPGSGRVR
ncbi:MAG: GIY-YIG nuclease family protein, partial [Rhodospirillaceae bacterium]|nr:GIY-YIG nuclease family protein [Rhodospirillaceae bacterium]